ncbi:elongation factor G [Desulfonatronovibrio hydrogenovorans]|uniref:elongation factor G n=1 Tax=Desulfonatronovibrio hydrogenovorans TaxID=53245 RepID=UPI00048B657B|nr:elongation factor G [Desulfonatronovibrio hydrogenovorans]
MLDKLEKQRTYALIGHGGAGKTSVAEMILYNSKAIQRLGKIEEGTTCLDFEPEEIKRRGSVQPGFSAFSWNKNRHYLIDIPGDNNFIGDISYLLHGVDGVVFVVDAIDGAKPLTKKIWSEAKKQGLPAIFFINKMDRERADFDMAYQSLVNTLGIKPVPLYLPIGAESDFRGMVDVLENKAYLFSGDGVLTPGEVPAEMADIVEEAREAAIENIAESDEVLMEKYLEEGSLTPEEMQQGLRAGVLSGEIVPICVGSALENKGGANLLDAVQQLLPSPLEHPAWQGKDGEVREASPDEHFSAFVFKTITDPFAGHLSVMRVMSGKLSADMTLFNPLKDEKEKLGQLLYLEGKKQTPAKEELGPGAIVAAPKLKKTTTGDTLCAEGRLFVLQVEDLPPCILSYALAAEEKGEEDKVFSAVQRLLDEDINLRLARNEETGDMLLSGMGQLHIETAVEKARRRYKANIVLKTPKIPYRETIKGRAEVQGRYKKQTGGRGQFGDCWIRLEPRQRGEGYEFEDAIVGGAIPRQYIPAVDKGIQETAAKGVVAGYPVVDFKVTLYDGSYHSVDSSEMAFKVAGSMAFKKAVEQCKPILLEPIVLVQVYVPDEYMGDVIGDLSSKRGKVLGSDSDKGITEVRAHVPMSEILQYAQDLRSMTGGQGTFTMEFDHYEECPAPIAEKIIAESKEAREG